MASASVTVNLDYFPDPSVEHQILRAPIGCSVTTIEDVLRDWCAKNKQNPELVVQYVSDAVADIVRDYASEESAAAVRHYQEHDYE